MVGDLSLIRVTKKWNTFSLKEITLNIKSGDYFVLVGPTGSGKTLLLETIQGFHQIDSGQILLDGQDITVIEPYKRRISYVPQTPNLGLYQSVRENLEYPLRRMNLVDKMTREVDGIMEMMNLSMHQDREVLTLSGGEKRKVALARALIQQPKLLLLDEPLSNLDVTSKQEIRDELRIIHNYLNVTVVHVTHDQQEALSLANHLGVIRKGSLVRTGTVDEVFDDPEDEYLARFLGYENIYNAKVEESGPLTTKMNVRDVILRASKPPKTGQTRIAIQGDDVRLSKQTPCQVGDNVFRGKVVGYNNFGPLITVTMDIGFQLSINMGKHLFLEQEIKLDEELWVHFSTQAVKHLRI